MDDDAWGDDDMLHSAGLDGDGAADWRTVLLKDAKLGRTIECFVDREIEVDGKQYATLMPADTPVIMAGYKEVNGSKNLVPVLDDKAIDELFPTAFAVLSEMDLTLSRSAVVLTVEEVDDVSMSDSEDDDEDDMADEFMVLGLGPDGESSVTFSLLGDDDDDDSSGDYDNDEVLSLGTGPSGPIGLRTKELFDEEDGDIETLPRLPEDSDDDDDVENDDGEKVQVLASFFFQGDKYVVATPLEPVLIIGAPTVKEAEVKSELRVGTDLDTISALPGGEGLKGKLEDAEDSNRADYVLPDREELERITPKIEEELESLLDEEEKDRKVLQRLRQQLINQWGRTE